MLSHTVSHIPARVIGKSVECLCQGEMRKHIVKVNNKQFSRRSHPFFSLGEKCSITAFMLIYNHHGWVGRLNSSLKVIFCRLSRRGPTFRVWGLPHVALDDLIGAVTFARAGRTDAHTTLITVAAALIVEDFAAVIDVLDRVLLPINRFKLSTTSDSSSFIWNRSELCTTTCSIAVWTATLILLG